MTKAQRKHTKGRIQCDDAMIVDVAQIPRGRRERSVYLSGAVTGEYILVTGLVADCR